jgi:hypothetical protein
MSVVYECIVYECIVYESTHGMRGEVTRELDAVHYLGAHIGGCYVAKTGDHWGRRRGGGRGGEEGRGGERKRGEEEGRGGGRKVHH